MSWSNGGDGWATGDARNFTPTHDEWNDSTTGVAGHGNEGFNDARTDKDLGDAAASPAGGAGGACFNCGQEGHIKAECTEQRKFTGECRACGQTGHLAKECPSKPKKCNQCLETGHDTIDCKNRKVLDMAAVPEMSEADAWRLMREASDERDIGDFKEALKILSKANPDITYLDIEDECRKRELDIYLVGLKKDLSPAYTNTNLQGEVGKAYTLGFFTSASCPRPILMPNWPKDVEENRTRLANAGIPLERGVIICGACGEAGHSRKACEQSTPEAPKVMCFLCGESGHRVRDCDAPRQKPQAPRACRICSSELHMAADCPEKRKMICRRCEQEGHKANECENEPVIRCQNCNELGHVWKNCPLPKDWSKVKCRNCGEMGHTRVRCSQAPKEEVEPVGDSGDTGEVGAGGDDWKTNVAEPITAGGW